MRLASSACALGLLGAIAVMPVCGKEKGVYDEFILFGQSAAFTGPAQELGKDMRLGIEAAFHEVNQQGGVYGRRLKLLSLDDAYEPEAAIANTRRLIRQDQVFALIGAVGTPTSRSAVPIATEANIPYVAPFTGAAFLRQTSLHNVINLRASYVQEIEKAISHLVHNLGVERIASIYQNDSFGRAGYQSMQRALERRGMELVAVGVYPRNTHVVKTALLDVYDDKPEAVIIIGAYDPVATLISWARRIQFDPIFTTISFVGNNALVRKLGADSEGIIITQVVPFPSGEKPAVVRNYNRALSALTTDAVPGFTSLEGYLAGRLAITALERCGEDVDRACFLDVLHQAGSIDLDGFKLRYGDNDNQGSDAVFLSVIGKDGRFHPVKTRGNLTRSCVNC